MEATWFDGCDTGCAAELEVPAAAPAAAAVAASDAFAAVLGLASAGGVASAALGVACQHGPARPCQRLAPVSHARASSRELGSCFCAAEVRAWRG
jgi:hypothetical protein